MRDMENEEYSSQQINIPPTFPFVLKQYAKAAIKTQPYDLVQWSAAYFRALAQGETPPAKDRLEFPPVETPSGLTPGYLHVLIKQLGKEGTMSVEELREKWLAVCLKEEGLYQMLKIGHFGRTLDWLCFVGVAAGFLTNSLEETMVLVCELLTEETPGGSASIPLTIFGKIYSYLATLDCGLKTTQSNEKQGGWSTDSVSISSPGVSSDSAQQLCKAVTSPQLSRVPNELDTSVPMGVPEEFRLRSRVQRSSDSSNTLTPEKSPERSPEQSDQDQEQVADEAMLQTFYDNTKTVSDSRNSSEEAMFDGNEGHITAADNNRGESSKNNNSGKEPSRQLLVSNSSAPEIKTNISTPEIHQETTRIKSTGVKNNEKAVKQIASLDELRADSFCNGDSSKLMHKTTSPFIHVPGIGAVVEPAHVATVLTYLKEIASGQDGMINPSNFCHFMCPPLEGHLVPSSPES